MYFKDDIQNNFNADFGFDKPHRTNKKCDKPVFADHYLHRISVIKKYHIGCKGDVEETGIPGWVSKRVCTGCGREFEGWFHPDKK